MNRLLFLLVPLVFASAPPQAAMNFTAYAESYGFVTETHTVTTVDGYILTLFRIPGAKNETASHLRTPDAASKPVMFFQHGFLDNADTWITNTPDITLGFQAVRAGFDCWFGNSRGTKYSRYNTRVSRDSAAFWEFTWQHMAEYDVPANFEYVLNYTKKEKLVYVGHSQGTIQMFAHLSEDPDFADKIGLFIAVAPVASVVHLRSKLINFLAETPFPESLEFLHLYDFLPYFGIPNTVFEACTIFNKVCADVIQFVADIDINVDNVKQFPMILAHEPGGSSIRNLEHWA
jgi:pimeloyl-ACP methyl ester carboxylesterase